MISFVVITYQHENFIARCIDSIMRSCDNIKFEILIVDDGSTDKTISEIRRYQQKNPDIIKLTAKDHQGIVAISKNLNSQINLCSYNRCIILAGDDILTDNSMHQRLSKMAAIPNCKLAISQGHNVNYENHEVINYCQDKLMFEKIRHRCYHEVLHTLQTSVPRLLIQGYIFDTEFLKGIGAFDESLIADDWVLNIRIFSHLVEQDNWNVFVEDSVTFLHVIHSNNTSRNIQAMYWRISQVFEFYGLPGRRRYLMLSHDLKFILKGLLVGNFDLVSKILANSVRHIYGK